MNNMEMYQKLSLCEFLIKDRRYTELVNILRLIDALNEVYKNGNKRRNKSSKTR